MKIEELSVGDWVKASGVAKRVHSIEYQNRAYFVNFSDLDTNSEDYLHAPFVKHIPLTPEILEKNGFVKEEDEDGNKRYSLIEGGTKFSLGYARSVFQWTFPIDVRYVHELQHALRLVGVEKEIEV